MWWQSKLMIDGDAPKVGLQGSRPSVCFWSCNYKKHTPGTSLMLRQWCRCENGEKWLLEQSACEISVIKSLIDLVEAHAPHVQKMTPPVLPHTDTHPAATAGNTLSAVDRDHWECVSISSTCNIATSKALRQMKITRYVAQRQFRRACPRFPCCPWALCKDGDDVLVSDKKSDESQAAEN